MTFRRNCMKHLLILGVILVILQIIVSTKFHPLNVRWQNSTSLLHRYGLEQGVSTVKGIDISTNKTIVEVAGAETNVGHQHGDHHEGHNGFQLASAAYNVCKTSRVQSPGPMNRVHVVLNKRLMYCPMEKIGTTFWRRLFYMLTVPNGLTRFKNPYDVPIKTALDNTKLFTQPIQTAKLRNMMSDSSFSFLFVRNPYSRVLSAFIDKLVPPNPYYWKAFGGKAVSMFRLNQGQSRVLQRSSRNLPTSHDVTFTEFIKLATYMEKTNRGIDAHIISTNKGCKPCSYPYKYIGRMETFKDDALFILKQAGLNTSASVMDKQFKLLSVYDAIEDSIESPFSWRKDVVKSISWDKALKRIWLKLQMRGIISTDKPLELSPERVENITSAEFINLAKKAYHASDPDQLKKQKDLVKREAFASVPLADIIAFRDTFKEDFTLFEYELSPSYVFERKSEAVEPTLFFNYKHLN